MVCFKSPAESPQCPEFYGNPRLLRRGTGSSNPFPSSGESDVNLTRRLPPPKGDRERRYGAGGEEMATSSNLRKHIEARSPAAAV